MADPVPTSITQTLPNPYLQGAYTALGERLLPLLATSAGINYGSFMGDQFVAGQNQLQQQAAGLAGGLGSYQPYLNQAGQMGQQAQQTLGGAQQYAGPQAYQQFMSPYQQDVINTTLSQYDVQAKKGLNPLSSQAIGAGAFGGAREGIQRAEYQSASDMNRAQLQAGLQNQGFGQANQLANQAYQQQLALAQQQQGLGTFQGQLGQQSQQLAGNQIQGLNASASYRNATIDTTLGYILGFHTASEYELDLSRTYSNPLTVEDIVTNQNVSQTIVTLTSDSVVNVYLYTYFMIILDDFNQNHLNDGLVTLSKRDYSVTLPSYANRKLAKQCNPVTNTITDVFNNSGGTANSLTQKQVYSVEQILAEQNKQKDNFNQGVYVRDMFALLPVKTSGAVPGSIYVEFGGTLQQQERVYFGPVNIRRIAVKLVNDKGDVVDLNGGNWSFQLVCEQLYQRGE